MPTDRISIDTATETLHFDPVTGRLLSFRAETATDQEFIVDSSDIPVFVIQYLDDARRFRQISSDQAEGIEVRVDTSSQSRQDAGERATLIATFSRLAGLDLDVTATVSASREEKFSRWRISVENDAGLSITDVQFPFVVVRYELGGHCGSEALLRPFNAGQLLRGPQPQDLQPDSPHAWQFRPENGDTGHYPGLTFAQFLAFYNDRAGIYIGCEDTDGRVKLIKPVHCEPGIRLGIAHVGDWPEHGTRKLEYDVVLGGFAGDWHAAAEVYREWSLQQKWARQPLHVRDDMPDWLLDSPPHVIIRVQGKLDAGPTSPVEEFLPYTKCIPLLEIVSKRVEAPVVPVIMSWERPGPWIYPDCFPPAGGEDSLREFTEAARERGWHIGSFCNGTRWVVGHFWSGYDGEDDFIERDGSASVCRTHNNQLWQETWDATWRPSYAGCLNVPLTQELAVDFVETLIHYGLDWIQFLDQNVGCATFPCYATDHDHPAAPGRWMTDEMQSLLDRFHQLRRDAAKESEGEREIVLSVECPPNEYFMPAFHICDVRVVPPGHSKSHPFMMWEFVPLYHFLYHEFILIQGGFGSAPEPYHLPIRNAYNWVVGEIPGAVLKGDGRLLNKDTMNWAPWEPQVGENEDALSMLHVTTRLRRGQAKEFLVYGRMRSPASVEGIRSIRWQEKGLDHQIPAVFHATWQAPDGRLGVVLANWTNEEQSVKISDSRLGPRVNEILSAEEVTSNRRSLPKTGLTVHLPSLSCALLAAAK